MRSPVVPKARKKTAFVPRIVFQAVTVAGVVPLCALGAAGCGGATFISGASDDAGKKDALEWTVAATCFEADACARVGVGTIAFDGVAARAFDAHDEFVFTVARTAFEGGFDGVAAEAFGGFDVAAEAFGDLDAGVVGSEDGEVPDVHRIPPGVAIRAFVGD
jgi:hypothetical protein